MEGQAAFTAGSLATNNLGVRGFASGLNDPGLLNNVGVMGQASFARQNYGGWFFAESPGPAENYGVRARATQATTNYGIRASAAGGTTNWAGWFEDDVWVQGNIHLVNGTIVISDQNLKTNITDLTDGLSRVLQLAPKSYQFLTADYPMMELSPDAQIGLLAQEVQQVIPEAVATAVYPAQYDTLGNQVSAAFPVMGVDYVKLIPLLIGAIHEQQAQITAMQQDLAACCAVDGGTDQRSMSPGARLRQGFGDANARAGEALRTDLFIVPNPVADHTQLRYTVATPGRTRLELSDAGGKRLEVLEEAVREAGAYTHDWSTTDLAPGTYHVTLYLNDSFVVKKAMKVGR